MTDDEYCVIAYISALRPADSCQEVGRATVGAEALVGGESRAQRRGGLLAPQCRTAQDAQLVWRVLLEPSRDLLGLFLAARSELAFEVGDTLFGLGVAPQQQIHSRFLFGESAVHRAMGFDHTGRFDLALSPSQPEGVWARQYLTGKGVTFLAFNGAVQGKATGAHIHIGPPSTRRAPRS